MKDAKTTPANPKDQREALLDSQRQANQTQARNFKEDALDQKVVSVQPDGTGPTSTESFDAETDQALGSGNDTTGVRGGESGADSGDIERADAQARPPR